MVPQTTSVERELKCQAPAPAIQKCLGSGSTTLIVTSSQLSVVSFQNVPHNIMENICAALPQPRRVPKGINDYTEEEIANFPKLWTP